jgi:hypothetical protein
VIKIDTDKIQATIANLKKSIDELAKTKLAIGVFPGSGESVDRGIPVAEYAAYQELGTATIPARSFLRWSAYLHKDAEQGYLNANAQEIVSELLDGKPATFVVATGQRWADYARKTIDSRGGGMWAPLKPATVAKKGHDTPLIEHEVLYNAIEYEVR